MKRVDVIPFSEKYDIKHYAIFSGLTLQERYNINQVIVTQHFDRGDVVYSEGNRINGTYVVAKGVLKVFKTGVDGRDQIIRFAKVGDLVGFRSVISEELACTTTEAITDVELSFLPGENLTYLIKSNPDFAMSLMKLTCRELGESNKYITDIAQKSVRERLAEVLLLLMDGFDLDDEGYLQITLTREEIANLVGTATETVIRLLSEFKNDHLIELAGKRIKLVNIPKLLKTANIFI
ncbi:MAG: Crp/Fnr family transcriptional regulator [Breznakibacter sp.]|nr:Crp/Fnr family transcriptional regulator [Breznakibacter sp.]